MADILNKFGYDSNYEAKTGFTGIKFGYDKPILETELNEMQIIQEKARTSIVRKLLPSGFAELVNKEFSGINIVYNPIDKGVNKLNHIAIAPSKVIVDGYELNLQGDFTINNVDEYVLVNLGEAPLTGEREDLVYLEVWFRTISSIDSIPEWSYQDGNIMDYSIVDDRVSDETSRRVAMCWNIRVANNIDFSKYPEGFGYKNALEYSPIKAIANGKISNSTNDSKLLYISANNEIFKDCEFYKDNNLWIAGRPDYTFQSSEIFGKYTFALPLFKVKRRNKSMYSIDNFNGSLPYNTSLVQGDQIIDSYIKGDLNNNIRPDRLSYDYITEEDLLDLRKTISVNDFKSDYYLNKGLKDLFTGELNTIDKNQTRRIQFGNTPSSYDSTNIVFISKFDKQFAPTIPGISSPECNSEGAAPIYERSLNGPGLLLNGLTNINYKLYTINMNQGTIDFFIQPYSNGSDDEVSQKILSIDNANGDPIFVFEKLSNKLIFSQHYDIGSSVENVNKIEVDLTNNLMLAKNIYHVRLSWSNSSQINSSFVYINGKLVSQGSYIKSVLNPDKLKIGKIEEISSNGCVIEELIIYNKAFEQNISEDNVNYIVNKYWPNLPNDFINHNTLLLPSFNGTFKTFSDNPIIQQDTIAAGKIQENQFVLNAPKGTIIDSATPMVYDIKGNVINTKGNWVGLGNSSTATFTLTEAIDTGGDELTEAVYTVESDLSKIPNHIEYRYSNLLKTLIENNIVISNPRTIVNEEYGIIINNNYGLKIVKMSNDEILYEGTLNIANVSIPGITIDLTGEILDQNISINDMIILKTTLGNLNSEAKSEILGNIPHINYEEKLKTWINANTTVTNELSIIDNQYIISVIDPLSSMIKIVEQKSGNELYKGLANNTITSIPGLTIAAASLYIGAENYDAATIITKKGTLINNKYELSQEVSLNYNYDANLKDVVASSIQVTNELAVINNSYDIVITNYGITPEINVVDISNGTKYIHSVPTGDITDIPGLTLNIASLPLNGYIYDAVRINTFSAATSSTGTFEVSNFVSYTDYYSENLRNVLLGKINIANNNAVVNGTYNLVVTNVRTPSFKIVDVTTNEIKYDGPVGTGITAIPGITIDLAALPANALANDSIQIKTTARVYYNSLYEILTFIPYESFSSELKNAIESTFVLKNIELVQNDDFKLVVTNLTTPNIVITKLSDNTEIYNGGLNNEILIPGIALSLVAFPVGVNVNSTIIISTLQIKNELNIIVKYNLVIPSGNGGNDLPTEILAAGKLSDNRIQEISFNRKDNVLPREVNFIKPRVVNGIYDKAYDYSYNRADSDCFARLLVYNVSGNGSDIYNIPAKLYGYDVIGIMSVLNRKVIECELIKNSITGDYYRVKLSKAIILGELIQFTLALGGMTFEYETQSKTLVSNICKTKILEVDSTGLTDYAIPCVEIGTHGGGVLKSVLTFTDNQFNDLGQLLSQTNKRIAYVDNKMFIPIAVDNTITTLASYTLTEGSIGSPFLKIKFDIAPQIGTKIKIPVLISYQPAEDEIISLWYKYTPYQGNLSNNSVKIKRISDWKYFITTLSSGNKVLNIEDTTKNSLNNIVNRLPGGLSYAYIIDGQPIKFKYLNDMFSKSDINLQLIFTKDVFLASENNDLDNSFFILDTDFEVRKNATGFQDGRIIIKDKDFKLYFPDCVDAINKYVGMASLVMNENGDIMLFVMGCLNNKIASTTNELIPEYGDLFKISGLPITIKQY